MSFFFGAALPPRIAWLTPERFRHIRAVGQPVVVPFSVANLSVPTSLAEIQRRFAMGAPHGMSLDVDAWLNHIRSDGPFDASLTLPVAQPMSSAAESLLGLRRPLLGLEADAVQQPHLWLGVSSYCTPTHCDDADNLILLLCGSKRLWITPPNSRAILQPTCIAQQCWANLLNPTDNHARDDVVESNGENVTVAAVLKGVQALNLTLRAGEILYLPAGWFHFVQNLEPTVMVNVWTAGRDRVAAGAGRVHRLSSREQ